MENLPSRIFAGFLNCILLLTDELNRKIENKNLEGFARFELPDEVKVLIASEILEAFLGRGGAYSEIAEASGVKLHKVIRIFKHEYSSLKSFYENVNIQLFDDKEFGLKRGYVSGKPVFIPKKIGRPKKFTGLILDRGGRPSKCVVVLPKNSPAELYNILNENEKQRLIDYLLSTPSIDIMKAYLKRSSILFSSILMLKEKPKFLEEICEIIKRSMKIIERNGLKIPDLPDVDDLWSNFKGFKPELLAQHVDSLTESEIRPLIIKVFGCPVPDN
ncbi:MAG: hypothetical protein QXQ94_09795 [Candidatus Bathyarchaeia archaeon]